MWLGHDLLAPPARVARGRPLVGAPSCAPGAPRRGRQARLESGFRRCRFGGGSKRGAHTGPDPTNRGKKGTKRHIVVDGHGTPLGVVISGSNVHDSKMLEAVLDDVPSIGNGRVGRGRRRPYKVHADKGYDYKRCREAIRRRGGVPRIARRGVESSERLGRHRWKVEVPPIQTGLPADTRPRASPRPGPPSAPPLNPVTSPSDGSSSPPRILSMPLTGCPLTVPHRPSPITPPHRPARRRRGGRFRRRASAACRRR